MDLIADANILFSAVIKDSITSDMFFIDQLHLYAPEFLLEEFSKYKEELLNKTQRSSEEFQRFISILERRVTLISEDGIKHLLKEAEGISPDPKDVAYIALALKLRCPLWSNDKRLRVQDKVKVYSAKELLEIVTGRGGK